MCRIRLVKEHVCNELSASALDNYKLRNIMESIYCDLMQRNREEYDMYV